MRNLLALALILTATLSMAAPQAYRLDTARSTVGFSYDIDGAAAQGTMPVKSAEITLDLDNLPNSRVHVTLDATGARAGFIIATQAMKDPKVLNTKAFPEIIFRSTAVTGDLSGAKVQGDLTLRGVTRPVMLDARLYRPRGTAPNDRRNLAVLLTGRISRAAFGASGYSGMVGDTIGLRIIARISR
ncbi:YceI family protein [Roseovarius sp. MMSF_3281]|uniref:YceI family protein n=1 Tax=Roseovarius sp. MMSF_3281 TaxID=3046694 RepID=UPI00273F3D8E|nr:YceI family protein [Roseovarius sp. MMSF_3281]